MGLASNPMNCLSSPNIFVSARTTYQVKCHLSKSIDAVGQSVLLLPIFGPIVFKISFDRTIHAIFLSDELLSSTDSQRCGCVVVSWVEMDVMDAALCPSHHVSK